MNEAGYESGNGLIDAMARLVPWLQDTRRADVWGRWDVVYRDVIVLDDAGRRVLTFNTDTFPIEDPGHLADLRARLLEAAGESAD